MEQTMAFGLGVLIVLIIVGIINVVKTSTKITKMQSEITITLKLLENLDTQMEYMHDDIQSDMEDIESTNSNLIEETINTSETKMGVKLTELETKFTSHTTSGVEVKKALDEIAEIRNDLDSFIKMYRNQ
jgi:type II secretory pathway component PulM